MEEIVDLEYVLRPLRDPVANPRIERFEIRSKRNAEFDRAEQYQNFVDYGSEFGEAQAPEPPDWAAFRRACEQHLADKAKDLWVAAWYVECLLLEFGFQGLSEGFQFVKALVEQHWDIIEPNPSAEDGIEDTVKMLSGLNNGSTFLDQLRLTPITVESGEHPALSVATIDQADESVRGKLVGNTSAEFRTELSQQIQRSLDAFEELTEILKERCADLAPPSARIRETLKACDLKIREIYPEAFVVQEEVAEVEGEGGEVSTVPGAVGGQANMSATSHVQNREEAFRMLETVANFFRENEPQSPVSYLLEKAVRWGRLALPDLIGEMVDDDSAKSQIFRLAGIKLEDSDGG